MKQFMHKTRKSGGLKRYRPPRSAERVSMMWGKWETVGKFNTLLEACDVLKDVRAVMVFGPGSTEHQITFGGKCVVNLDADEWHKARHHIGEPATRATIKAHEKHLRGGQ